MMKEFLFPRLVKIELSSKSAELRYKRAEEQVLTETKYLVRGTKDWKVPQEAKRPSSSFLPPTLSWSLGRTQSFSQFS